MDLFILFFVYFHESWSGFCLCSHPYLFSKWRYCKFCSGKRLFILDCFYLWNDFFDLGVPYFLIKELPRAFSILSIHASWSRNLFAFVLFLILFGYFGGVGFTQPCHIAHVLSGISWSLVPISFLLWVVVGKCKK